MPTVTFVPRHVAEALEPMPDTLLISITHPGDLADVDEWSPNLLCLYFDDIEMPIAGHTMFGMGLADHALHQVACVKEHDVIVHCEAGMSRSAAFAKWLADNRGYDLWLHPEGIGTAAHYNKHVYRTLDAASGTDMAAYYAELERDAQMMGGVE